MRNTMALYTSGQARRSLIDTVAYRAVSQLATVLGYVVMVRAMTKEDFGVFNLLYAFIPVVSTVASLGLEQTLRRYQPEYLQAGNTTAAAWLMRFVASARFGTNVIVLSLILLGWNHIAPIFKLTPYRAEFVLLCALVLLHFQAGILQLSLASHMLHRFSVGSIAVIAVVKLSAYAMLAWTNAFSLENAIIADTVAFAVAYVILLRAHRAHCAVAATSAPYRPDPAERRRLMRYGIFNNFNDAGTLVLTSKTDNFFIAAFLDPVSVGIYAFYTRLKEMSQQLMPVRLFENVIRPLFFSVAPGDADSKIPGYFSLLLNMNLMLQWPVLAFCVTYHAELVQVVFGGRFIEDSWLLPVVVALASINVIDVPVTLVAQYEEKAGIILASKIFGVYNIIVMLMLLPVIGIYGAAIASGSAQALKSLFIWWHVRRRARWVNVASALFWGGLLWFGIMAAGQFFKGVAGGHAVASLLTGVALIGLGVLLHVRSPAISRFDRALLTGVLHGRERSALRWLGLIDRPRASD
jgi:O-antigen/teichoic acid export membrane protein